MAYDPAVERFLRQPELTDEECEARAMLVGGWVRYVSTIRVYGKRVLRDDVELVYLNPVTLEVIYRVGDTYKDDRFTFVPYESGAL